MTQEEFFMKIALEEAQADPNEVPVGALIVLKDKIIARAHNEREKNNHPLAHAEILAIHRAAVALQTRRLTACTLYVTLEPCPMCAGALIMAQLERCVFGAFDAQQGCCGSVYTFPQDEAFAHHVLCTGGVLAKESSAILSEFFRTHRYEKLNMNEV